MKEQMQKMADLNKSAVETMQKVADINTGVLNALMTQQMNMISAYTEASSKHMKSLSEAKRVQDVLSVQSEAVQDMSKKALENVRGAMEILVDGKNKMTALVEESVKEATANNPFAKLAA